jgi:hypothetical protein
MPKVHVALVHYPVVNRIGETIAAAVTNLDLHDIARVSKTFGVSCFFTVTPVADQKMFTERIVAHWTTGPGAEHIPDRRHAMELVRITESVAEAVEIITGIEGRKPTMVATCARPHPRAIPYARLRSMLNEEWPHLLLFGTAWGLSPEVIAASDHVLAPIVGVNDYNHLSVRSAAAIVLDRLLGRPDAQC